jgi:hypothetical protein
VHGVSPAAEAAILCSWALEHGSANIALPPWRADGELGRELSTFAEEASVGAAYNFVIFKWAEAVNAFLRLRAATSPIPLHPGRVTLDIEGYGCIALNVSPDGDATCHSSSLNGSDSAALHLTELQAMSVLFGPRAPWATVELPVEASLLAAWCPLPLYISHQVRKPIELPANCLPICPHYSMPPQDGI